MESSLFVKQCCIIKMQLQELTKFYFYNQNPKKRKMSPSPPPPPPSKQAKME